MDKVTVKQAMDVIKQAMIDDNPSELGSYAHSWHCNIAMVCYDSMFDTLDVYWGTKRDGLGDDTVSHEVADMIANEAASRFMKLCFGVETGGSDDTNSKPKR